MTWQEQAEYVLGELQYALDNPGHLHADIRSYVRESAERIAFLEKALAQAMETNLQLQVIEAPCILNGVSPHHIGKECITFGGYYPGEVLELADEYKELAQWLREQENDHIVDAQEMVEEQQ